MRPLSETYRWKNEKLLDHNICKGCSLPVQTSPFSVTEDLSREVFPPHYWEDASLCVGIWPSARSSSSEWCQGPPSVSSSSQLCRDSTWPGQDGRPWPSPGSATWPRGSSPPPSSSRSRWTAWCLLYIYIHSTSKEISWWIGHKQKNSTDHRTKTDRATIMYDQKFSTKKYNS